MRKKHVVHLFSVTFMNLNISLFVVIKLAELFIILKIISKYLQIKDT